MFGVRPLLGLGHRGVLQRRAGPFGPNAASPIDAIWLQGRKQKRARSTSLPLGSGCWVLGSLSQLQSLRIARLLANIERAD